MRRALMIMILAIGAMIGSTITVSAASPSATNVSNPDAVVQSASYSNNYDQKNGVCAYTYQLGKAWMTTSGGYINFMQIDQRFQWYGGGRWHTAKTYSTWTSYYSTSSRRLNTSAHRFYYSGSTSSHTTRIRTTFRWYHNNSRIYTRYDTSGYCYP